MSLLPSSAVRPACGELPALVAGRYRIERLLGVGGMGAVYRARDLLREQFGDPEPVLALKTLAADFADYPDADALLHAEFALTSRLHHPHVVRAHAFDLDPASGRAFFTLELLRGPGLDQLLDERPEGLAPAELGEIAVALAGAVAHAHRRGVLHGDLKPGNAILAEDGLHLIDFGLGQLQPGVLPGLPRLDRERFAAWTPCYAAPELLDGAPLSAAADVYALACLLYELAAGRHPFARLDARQAREQELQRSLTRPSGLPPHCWPALRTALAFDPAQRRIDAAGLLAAFRAPAPGRLRRWLRLTHG
ncbi:serine/threonine protein kinase [Azotobacter chroococcum]|uniref:serine/threonine-protein kinase n=1 Tax=Azotobacter chroococcum TaxID=353 RepID=UPI00103B0289|nr:serine/threonine-protein kinase [Azotobacter chroococcum]TBW10163.1 serine/threonine protein kinase [Azotobacter chroococcum]